MPLVNRNSVTKENRRTIKETDAVAVSASGGGAAWRSTEFDNRLTETRNHLQVNGNDEPGQPDHQSRQFGVARFF